jgi:UDP-glucose-4-epimerase GalE
MSAVLVTGGAGYVGSHTVKALAAAGYDVIVCDDLSAGHAEAVEALAAAFPQRTIKLVRADIADNEAVRGALRQSKATAVLHFAARLLVGESVAKPLDYYHANVTKTVALLGAMAAEGVGRLIFSSTCATFGEPQIVPIDEQHPQRPINTYGETKLAIERALPHLERATGMRSVALRYFNAAGADPDGLIGEDHEPEEHLIPLAIRAARGRGQLTVYGDDYPTPDGTCIRDYVHVTDLADAHVAALRMLERGGASAAYNLGHGEGISVRQIIDAVGRVTGHPVPHQVGARRPGDPATLIAASGRAKRELQWAPRLSSVDEIIRTAWQWHSRHPQGYASRAAGRG